MDGQDFAQLKKRLHDVDQELASGSAVTKPAKLTELSRERARLEPIVERINRFETLQKEKADAEKLLSTEKDDSLKDLAREELGDLEREEQAILKQLDIDLLPVDSSEDRDSIVEIRAGAGGDEAGLFAAELTRMYTRFAERKGFKAALISSNRTGIGGFKEAILEIKGSGSFAAFKFESGVHRVQRVPETEKSGRVHTSTATVAVLPIAEEVDVEIKPNDLQMDVFRAGGHGGQSVNTTDSAVRITHLPTGLVVSMQDERSQLKNKEKAMRILRSRLLAYKQERAASKRGSMRRVQVGTGDRSEKIRTYNLPQDRITDHRIKYTVHGVQPVLDGNLDELLAKLVEANRQQLKMLTQKGDQS
ncbi:MAG: peptide chain release factor 1 [bacterium]|nr:peptide chain release factor 1 [bacterium]